MELLTALLIVNAILLLVILRIVYKITKPFRRGDDMNRVTKSLIITLAGLIAARLAKSALKKVL